MHHSLTDMVEYHYEIPSITSTVLYESDSNIDNFQIFAEGSTELIIESCGDYWNGNSLGQMNAIVEKKIFEFHQNALISDLEVVTYSYRPMQNSNLWNQFRNLKNGDPAYICLPSQSFNPAVQNLKVEQAPQTHSPAESFSSAPDSAERKVKKRKNRDRVLSRVDVEEDILNQQEIFTEITKGQTFLCASSFVYPPKPNMVDFVEDLALAGIRFVYFSSAPERESKAYAERLGLEIDWNSCIILSSDNGGPGYLAIHDMKAQLPRGVETIRNHIVNVDDVPLHVSLFAECKPYTIREMIKIFQEYGEVVCCIGSSLNDLNLEIFANVLVNN